MGETLLFNPKPLSTDSVCPCNEENTTCLHSSMQQVVWLVVSNHLGVMARICKYPCYIPSAGLTDYSIIRDIKA